MRLLITANSPGELALLRAVSRTAAPHVRVEVLLLPCSFATGQEAHVAAEIEGVSRVYSLKELPGVLWRGLPGETTLLHLGGDLMYSAFLAWRWRWPAWSYLWTRPWWNGAFRGFFTRNEWGVNWLRQRKAPAEKIHLIGDLIADAVWPSGPPVPEPQPGVVTIMAGSREIEFRMLTPFFLEVAERLPEVRFQLLISPHIRDRKRLLEAEPEPRVGGVRGRLDGDVLHGPRSSLLIRTDGARALAGSQLAVSIPGTKTAEAGVLEIPTLTVILLNVPEGLPGAGLLGLLGKLPGGASLVGRMLARGKQKIGLLAQPNQLAGERFMPELVDHLDTTTIADAIAQLLANPDQLQEMRRRLREIYSDSWGASARLVETLLPTNRSYA